MLASVFIPQLRFGQKLISVCLFICVLFNGSALSAQSDSLYKVYLNKKNADTLRWKALLAFAFDMQYADPDSAITLSKLALNESAKESNPHFKIVGLMTIATALSIKDENQASIQLFDSVVKLQLRTGELSRIGNVYCNMAIVYENLADYPKCEHYMRLALEEAERINSSRLLTSVYGRYSNYYYTLSNYPKAIEYAFKELSQYDNHPNEDPSGVIINIGIYYGEIGNEAKSAEYVKRGLAVAKKFGNKLFAANALYNLASNSINKTPLERELISTYLDEAMQMYKDLKSVSGEAGIYLLRGIWQINLHNYNDARNDLTRCAGMYHELGDPHEESSAYLHLGEICMAEKNTACALEKLQHSLELARFSKNLNGIALALSKLYTIYKAAGKKSLALDYYEEYVALKDSMFNDENRKSILKNELTYEYEKEALRDSVANAAKIKEERLINEQAIRQQRTYTYAGLGGFVLMIVIAAVSFSAFRNKQKANAIIMHQKQMVEEKQKEVLDSIHYARRIQRALITSEKYVEKTLDRLNK